MLRYWRLYLNFMQFSFGRSIEFRFDFFFRIFMDVIYYVVNIFFFKIVLLHTRALGGWTGSQMMIFVSGYLLIDAVAMTLYSNGMYMFPTLVNRGDLDYYLLRPVSTLFFVSFRDFAWNSFVNVLITVGIMIWAFMNAPVSYGWLEIFGYLICLAMGSMLFYLTRVLSVTAVFWLHSVKGIEVIFYNLNRFMERPDRIFRGPLRVVLTTIIPYSLMASFPARFLLEHDSSIIFYMATILVLYFVFTTWVWRAGLRSYSSASS